MSYKATVIHAGNKPERAYKIIAAPVYRFFCLENCSGGKLEHLLKLAYN